MKQYLFAGLLATACIATAQAQQEERVLEEVIVTAQKRVENVQDIPMTINVVDGGSLDQFTIRNTNDLAESVPGLVIQHTPQNLAQVAIRGLGTGSASESLDQSVGLFIDGVWSGRIREFQTALFDLERVEVIKGTQTALLGKNTSLGALSIVSKRPGESLGGYVQADYETEFDSTYVTGAIDLPTRFGNYRLAFNEVAEEGYVSNVATGQEVPERDQTTIRLGALYNVTDDGSLYLSYQYDDLEILGDTFQPDEDQLGFMAGMDPGADIGIDTTKNAYTSYSDHGDADDEQESHRAIALYEQGIGDFVLTSLTGWSEYDNERLTDTDFLSVDYLTSVFSSEYEQFSQELRIASPLNERFEYLAGIYYHDSTLDYANITDSSFPPPYLLEGIFPVDSASLQTYEQDTKILSTFGQGTLYLGDRWRATVGLRYTDEDKDAVWARERLRSGSFLAEILAGILAPVVEPTPLERGEHNLDGSINLQYDPIADITTYLSWASGSKSGGFTNDVAYPEEAEFETERADTTELGFKMSLGQGVGLLNAALFYTEIDDFQVVSFIGTGFLTSTVPARSQGVELEGQWAVSRHLRLAASATWADAEEEESGDRLPYAPEWSANLSLDYVYPWSSTGLEWQLAGAVNYRDEQYQQRGERSLDNALTMVDLRLALASSGGRWEVAVLGKNLLDEESSFGFDFPFFGGLAVPEGSTTIGSLNRPRTLALQGRYNF
jgi:iron complex outermembrane recepter protein